MSKFRKDKHNEAGNKPEDAKEEIIQTEDVPEKGDSAANAEDAKEGTVTDKFALELLAKAEEKVKEYKDMAQRVQAEFENYRKRNNDAVKVSKADGENGVILAMLPLLDTIGIAMKMVTEEKTIEGLNLIIKQFNTLLAKYGVEEIKAEGEVFNPDFHNAVMQVEDPDNSGKVTEVLQKGYIRDGKVIRYAMVKVAA